jgi:hypothetical protein
MTTESENFHQDEQENSNHPEVAETAAPVDTAPPVKRGRGRPRKEDAAPRTAETVTSTGAKRGPKPKATKKAYTPDDIGVMGKQLCGLHLMVAQITGLPEMCISEQESVLLAQSVVNVADEYGLSLDGKTGAALQLFLTGAMIYGPRALAVRGRMMKARQDAQSTMPPQAPEMAPAGATTANHGDQ